MPWQQRSMLMILHRAPALVFSAFREVSVLQFMAPTQDGLHGTCFNTTTQLFSAAKIRRMTWLDSSNN
ncbi:hypothetical protein M758_3G102500 [Ceratodon purpureus]|nr:hypothetical protein M758_3G102500 [Ceratodon purpureus]